MKIIMLFILLVIYSYCQAQYPIFQDSVNRINANSVIQNNLDQEVEDNDYLLFSIENKWYLIIIKESSHYNEIYIKNDSIYFINQLEKADGILKKAFDVGSYKKCDTINEKQSEVEVSNGNRTYFYFKTSNGKLHGESSSVTIITPTPIDNEIYYYLLKKLMYYIELD